MAKVYNPSSREIYGPLKGIVDFYYHKGQLCARSYPDTCRQPHTPGAVRNWDAQRSKWTAARLLTQNDKDGYSTVAGGSQLSWIDLFSKGYIKGWHMRNKPPPMLYDVQIERVYDVLRICCVSTEKRTVELYYDIDMTGNKVKPWKWSAVMPSPPPPNCSIKSDIAYTFARHDQMKFRGGGEVQCVSDHMIRKGFGMWVMLEIKGDHDENVFFRTGAWYLAN